MQKRWAIAFLISSATQASWYVEPRLYSGDELGEGVMMYYSLPWLDVGAGVQSSFEPLKDEHDVDTEMQLNKAFQLNERWLFSIGFGALLGKHWLSDYQFRYRINDFSWLTAGYRYHLEEDYDNQNQLYLGYRLSFSDAKDALDLSSTLWTLNEFMTNSKVYAHTSFGQSEDTSQWGAGLGMSFGMSPWGVELNMVRSETVQRHNNKNDLNWMALSGTYRWESLFFDDLTLKSGLGVASVHQKTCCQSRIDERNWALTPDIELSYRLNEYWDAFGGYRFFVGEGSKGVLSPDALMLGVRAYWARPVPVTTLLNDNDVPPAIEKLRSNTFMLSQQIAQSIEKADFEPYQFFIQPDNTGVKWQSLVLTLNDKQVYRVPLVGRVGRLMELLPEGKQTLHFTLVGQEESGAIRQVETSQLVMVERNEKLNVSLSVKANIFGETLYVQTY